MGKACATVITVCASGGRDLVTDYTGHIHNTDNKVYGCKCYWTFRHIELFA